ncbi:MAG: hypothetical protein HFI21_06615 [Lachnospiraceae bacterium]|nr:hypothetical protein [Lachnospiraceae bacterium]
MKKILFSPSICTGGYGDVREALSWLESKGADRIHIDIMDGRYVHPIMGGVDYANMVRENTFLPIELHFMTYGTERFLEMYDIRENEIIYIHPDSTYHPHRLLQTIRAKKAKAGIVISVEDEPEDFVELYEESEFVLLMGVTPGCPGSEFQESVFGKIRKIREICKEQGIKRHIEVDGSVSPRNIERLIEAGFDSAVLGYPGCFDPVNGREKTISTMIRLAQ